MTELAVTERPSGAALAEQVVIKGDLSKLTELERMQYYTAVCTSLGLNPLTRPFEFITLNGKLTLYATRAATDQLRVLRGITITGLDPRQVGELLVVVATGRDRSGREDSSTGAVSTKGLAGEALANAMMKAETKAKRRLTLSLAGLGIVDESEVGSIAGAVREDVDPETGEIHKPPTLAERVAEKAAAVTEPTTGLSTADFMRNLAMANITTDDAAAARYRLFPKGNLTDEQRAVVWAELQKPADARNPSMQCGVEVAGFGECTKPAGHDGPHESPEAVWPQEPPSEELGLA